MELEAQFAAGLQIVLAIILSMVIGLNRQGQRQPAGLRTHMLVGAGAALFTILSKHAFSGSESARVAAQIIPGIGFLGAGTILQRKGDVHHLTTAASIWATAAVGMGVGAGAWLLAMMSTLAIWVILAVMGHFEDKPEYIPKSRKNGRTDVSPVNVKVNPDAAPHHNGNGNGNGAGQHVVETTAEGVRHD